jgi:peptide/nickel transport system substrate-binding protein
MKKIKIMALLLASAMIMMSGVGCSNGGDEKVEKESSALQTESTESAQKAESEVTFKDTIVYALWSSPDGFFNPALSNTTYDGSVNGLVYDSLIGYDVNMKMIPAMAKSWSVSEDEKTLSFELRNDIKWHDGQTVTSEDVVFTFESLADAGYTGAYGSTVEGIVGYDEYNAGDADHISGINVEGQTISIELKDVYAPALMNIGQFGILPKHIWGEVAVADWQESSELLANPIGCGPYKFVEFEDGHHLKLEANEDYFDGPVATKNFIFKITSRDSVQVELENGEVDIADVSDMKPNDIQDLEANGIALSSFPNNLIQYMGFNLRDDRFKDIKVRSAIMHGIDRKLMVDVLVGGQGQLINTPMIPTGWAYPDASSLNPYEYDVEKAKALLAEAGWEDRDNDGILEDKDGNDFKVVLTYPSGDKSREDSAPIIQSYMKDLGVDMELEMLEFKATMVKVVGNHEFDLYLMGNSLDSDPDPKPYWHSTAMSDEKGVYAWNIAGFQNADADSLMEAGLATTDQNERTKIYNDFGVLMNKELPWVTLYSKDIMMAHNPHLKNYNPSTYTRFVDVEDWKIEN